MPPNTPSPYGYPLATSPHGTVIAMNVFVDPSNVPAYLHLAAPIAARFRKVPECLFVELSQNPGDDGHIRIVHGWTKGSEWWHETFFEEPWFKEFIEKARPMWTKPRVIEHYNRIAGEEYM